MTNLELMVLAGVLAVMAAVPSTSVVVVVSRSLAFGVRHGAAAAVGIVAGDLVFVALALAGLSVAAEVLGDHLAILRYLGGLYLVVFGIVLLRTRTGAEAVRPEPAVLAASFASGFLLTLGDLKAVFFYASLFPVFVDMGSLGGVDALLIVVTVVLSVGAVKFGYAWLASRVGAVALRRRQGARVRKVAGGASLGTGILVLAKG